MPQEAIIVTLPKVHTRLLALFVLLLVGACEDVPTRPDVTEEAVASAEMDAPIAPVRSVIAGVSQGPNANGNGKVYYTDANSFSSATPFYEYDVATDTWTQRASLPGRNTTQLAADENGTVYALPEDGNIYAYDPGADAWNFVMSGPTAAIGRRAIAFFEAHGGEFYWGDDGTSTLRYTSGGTWQSAGAPRALSSGSSIDRATGRILVRTYRNRGFVAFDPGTVTFQVCDDGTTVFENSRVGAFYDGRFYTRTVNGPYQAYDVSTCGRTDTGVAPTSTHSSTAEDGLGNIYSNGWNDDTVFEVYHVPTNTLLRLADAPDIPGNAHSTLVAVATLEITVDLDIKPGSDRNPINLKSKKGVIPVAILGSAGLDVADIDRSTLAFGPGGATPAHAPLGHVEDVNGDGIPDLVSHYRTGDTGLAPGDTEACVTGETVGGTPFSGCDVVDVK